MFKKTKTATGMALIDLALKLKKKDPQLTLEEAKFQAKKQIEAKQSFEKKQQGLRDQLTYGTGGKLKRKALVKLFGETIGGGISDRIRSKSKDDDIANQLLQNELNQNGKGAAPSANTSQKINAPSEYQKILKKLTSIEAEIKAIKAVKVVDPNKKSGSEEPILKSPHHEDATLGLKALGYKQDEIVEMLKNAQGSTAQELIKSALKPKNSTRIRTDAVPAAVETAKADAVPAAVETAKATVHVQPAPLSPAPRVSTGDDNTSQKEAQDTMKNEKSSEDIKADKEQKKKILEELDDIKKHISGGGLMSLLGDFFKPLLEILPIIGTALTTIAPVLGGLVAIAGAAFAGYEIGKWLNNKFGLSEKIGEEWSTPYDNKAHGSSAESIGLLNKKLEGTGYTSIGAGKFKDSSGNVVNNKMLPPSVKTKLGQSTNETTWSDAPPTVKAEVASKATQSMAASKIADASESIKKASEMSPSQEVTQHIDARKTTVMPPAAPQSNPIVIAVRNTESTVANYIAGLFNHPTIRLGL